MKSTNGKYVKMLKGDVMRCTYLKVIMRYFNGSSVMKCICLKGVMRHIKREECKAILSSYGE